MEQISRITLSKYPALFLLLLWLFPFSQFCQAQRNNKDNIAFIGDTQEPLFFEKWFISGNRNGEANDAILSNILKEANLKALFHLGDIVSIGSFNSTWKKIDSQLTKLKKANIPVYPAMGNHDYMIFKNSALENYFRRFPEIKSSWYSVIIDSIAIVILNSNYNSLSSSQIENQKNWYNKTLKGFQIDYSVKAIIVCLHHSPYTNSVIVNPSSDIQNDFVPLYLKIPKCKLFISGHAHAFEHFRQGGKEFIVSGGGGGLQQPVLLGNEQRWSDLFPIKTETRMFHYLICSRINDTLKINIMFLKNDFRSTEKVYEIVINCKELY